MSPASLFLFIVVVTAARTFAEKPKLVFTSPRFWEVNVNAAAQKEISLTFDQPLRNGFWDWFGRDTLSPASDLHTLITSDRMSCSVKVNLAPGRVYICGLNERGISGVGFQNEKGQSLPPTYLVFQTAGNPAPDDAPPRIAKTAPGNGTQQVDPAKATAIAITFDQPMSTKKHGLRLFENEKSVDISKLAFSYSSDGRTFTLPYTFRTGTQYRLELNSVSDIGFSRANRVPLWPVQISFSTQ